MFGVPGLAIATGTRTHPVTATARLILLLRWCKVIVPRSNASHCWLAQQAMPFFFKTLQAFTALSWPEKPANRAR